MGLVGMWQLLRMGCVAVGARPPRWPGERRPPLAKVGVVGAPAPIPSNPHAKQLPHPIELPAIEGEVAPSQAL